MSAPSFAAEQQAAAAAAPIVRTDAVFQAIQSSMMAHYGSSSNAAATAASAGAAAVSSGTNPTDMMNDDNDDVDLDLDDDDHPQQKEFRKHFARRKAELYPSVVAETAFQLHMMRPLHDNDLWVSTGYSNEVVNRQEQRTEVLTWEDFFSYSSVLVWPATPPNQVDLSFIRRPPGVDMRWYREYLSHIDLYTAVSVYEAMLSRQPVLEKIFRTALATTPIPAVEYGSNYDDPILRFTSAASPRARLDIATQWAAYHFNATEVTRLKKLLRSVARRTNTLYMLPPSIRVTPVGHINDIDLRLVENLDIQTAWFHIDYSSAEAFRTTVYAAIRRFSFVRFDSMFDDGEENENLNQLFVAALKHIIETAVTRVGDRFDIMHEVERTVVQLMETLSDDPFTTDAAGEDEAAAYYMAYCQRELESAENEVALHPGDMNRRNNLFVTRRLECDDYCFVDRKVRAAATISLLCVTFLLTSKGPYAHPSLDPLPIWLGNTDGTYLGSMSNLRFDAHHALAVLILSGASPHAITCFVDRWNPLRHGAENGDDGNGGNGGDDVTDVAAVVPADVVAAADTAVSRAGALAFGSIDDGLSNTTVRRICLPILWVMRQLVNWGDLDVTQMVALGTYLDHPFCYNISAAHIIDAGVEIAQILTSIPVECNLFRVCMGIERNGAEKHAGGGANTACRGTVGAIDDDVNDNGGLDHHDEIHGEHRHETRTLLGVKFPVTTDAAGFVRNVRLRELVFAVIAKYDSVEAVKSHQTRTYPGSPFSYQNDRDRPSNILRDFNLHLLCVPRVHGSWQTILQQMLSGANPFERNKFHVGQQFMFAIANNASLLMCMSCETAVKFRQFFQSELKQATEFFQYQQRKLATEGDTQTYQMRIVRRALNNIETYYFAHHRALATLAQSRLFSSRSINQPNAPFTRHMPADVVSEIVGFLTPAVGSVAPEQDTPLSLADIFRSVGTSFGATLSEPTLPADMTYHETEVHAAGAASANVRPKRSGRDEASDATNVVQSPPPLWCSVCTASQVCARCQPAQSSKRQRF